MIQEIVFGGLLVGISGVAFGAYLKNRKVALGDVYTDRRDEATYGKHVGPVDAGLTREIRRQVYEHYGYVCQITGRSGYSGDADTNGQHLMVGLGAKVELQVGHVIPHELGGPTVLWNLMPMEKKLNNALKDKVTPMAERLCRQRREKIWIKGIRKTTFEIEKRKLAKKRKRLFA